MKSPWLFFRVVFGVLPAFLGSLLALLAVIAGFGGLRGETDVALIWIVWGVAGIFGTVALVARLADLKAPWIPFGLLAGVVAMVPVSAMILYPMFTYGDLSISAVIWGIPLITLPVIGAIELVFALTEESLR
ncbi:MAG: hypothetical protein AAAFM81_05535 [Pseudomonadota bacterium]